MRLEVGKKYRARDGGVIKITKSNSRIDYPFWGITADGKVNSYTPDGRVFSHSSSPNDCMLEIQEKTAFRTLQGIPIGTVFRTREGTEARIMTYEPHGMYPVRIRIRCVEPDGKVRYRLNSVDMMGRCTGHNNHPWDLISIIHVPRKVEDTDIKPIQYNMKETPMKHNTEQAQPTTEPVKQEVQVPEVVYEGYMQITPKASKKKSKVSVKFGNIPFVLRTNKIEPDVKALVLDLFIDTLNEGDVGISHDEVYLSVETETRSSSRIKVDTNTDN